MTEVEVHQLLPKIAQQQCNEAEMEAFNAFISEADYNVVTKLADAYYALLTNENTTYTNDLNYTLLTTKIEEKLNQYDSSATKVEDLNSPFYGLHKWKTIAAAAVIIFIMIAIGYFFMNPKLAVTKSFAQNIQQQDVLAGSKKAILTIENGTNIDLDKQKNGVLTNISNHQVEKNNDQLVYTNNVIPSEIQYHTITTPNGGEYEVVLADGTKVWLNAASTLRFPTAFVGNNRTVSLTGEAYFEVTTNKNKPFIVQVENTQIQVLGTRFNIMSYANEQAIKTTLVEGSVLVTNNNNKALLQPGNQAIISKQNIETIPVDVNEAIAWKNGLFTFNKTELKTIMRQLARWYDVEVTYLGNIPEKRFVGDIERNSNLSQVLKILASSGIKFTIEGKKLIVTI